ncbi:hypothetical protein ACP4OV_030706 [Aristida adscensionis]
MARRRKRRLSSDTSPEPVVDRRGWPAKGVVESDSDCDGYHIKLRFSTARISRFVKTLNETQKGFIEKHGFGFILDVQQFVIPIGFIERVMKYTDPYLDEFIFGKKRIKLNSDMVCKVLGVPSGNIDVKFHTNDPDVAACVAKWKSEYKVGRSYPIKKCLELMFNNNDEETFMRSFFLFLISTILIPDKSNTIRVDYLYFLVDINSFADFDWAGHILHVVMSEVLRFQKFRDFLGRPIEISNYCMEGCLPLLPIIYMDFLDLPESNRQMHSLNYSTPRISHARTMDFDLVTAIDKDNNSTMHHAYGVRPFRHISSTPYKIGLPARVPENILHPHVKALVDKHNLLWKEDVLPLKEDMKNIMLKFNHAQNTSAQNGSTIFVSPRLPVDAKFSHAMNSAAIGLSPDSLSEEQLLNAGNVNGGFGAHTSGLSVKEKSLAALKSITNCTEETDNVAIQEHALHDDALDLGPGIDIAMNYHVETITESLDVVQLKKSDPSDHQTKPLGESTIEKNNRKKRRLISTQVSDSLKLKLSHDVEDFYAKYVRNRLGRRARNDSELLAFVSINQFHMTYPEFHESFKNRANLSDKGIAVYAHVFNNLLSKTSASTSRTKICFGPYFAGKLNVDPSAFVAKSCLAELKAMHEAFQLTTADLHWVLVCFNLLHGNINFFDSLNLIKAEQKTSLLNNMIQNFTSVCALAGIFTKGFKNFKESSPKGYPKQQTIHDCGFFCMIYMELFDGKAITKFDEEYAQNFRKLAAYRIATSPLNEVDITSVTLKA